MLLAERSVSRSLSTKISYVLNILIPNVWCQRSTTTVWASLSSDFSETVRDGPMELESRRRPTQSVTCISEVQYTE